ARRVAPVAAPVPRGEERCGDLRPVRDPLAVVVVDQRVVADLRAEVGAVAGQLLVREGLVPADELAGDTAARPPFAEPVLDGLHLMLVPVRPERRERA